MINSFMNYLDSLPQWIALMLSACMALGIVVFLSLLLLVFIFIKEKLNRPDEPDDNFYVDAAYFHEKGQRARQEDALYVSPLEDYKDHGLIALVTDGMGGMAHGDFVSRYVVSEFSKIHPKEYDNRDFIVKKIKDVSNSVYKRYNFEAGATLVLVRINNNMLDLYSVGDSDLILIRNGKSTKLNHKQNYGSILINNLASAGKPTSSAYEVAEARQLIDFIGNNNPNVSYTRQSLKLLDEDIILIASDGVLDALSIENLTELTSSGDARRIASRIKSEIKSLKLNTQDNYTCILLKLRHMIF